MTSVAGEEARRVRRFLMGTFTVTWGAWWALAALTANGTLEAGGPAATALLVLGGSAPTWMAYLAVWRTPGAGSVRELTARVLRVRVPAGLLVGAVLGAALLGLLSRALADVIAGVAWPQDPAGAALVFVPAFATGIVLGGIEEVGWRGVLQPALRTRHGLVTTNLVIAVVWALWHLPLFWVVGDPRQGASFGLFALAGLGYSAGMTWLYDRTGSVALCVLFHAGINAATAAGLSFAAADTPGFAVQAVVLAVLGSALLMRRARSGGG